MHNMTRCLLLSGLVGLSWTGCSSSSDGPAPGGGPLDLSGFEGLECVQGVPDVVSDLNPAQTFDYIALRHGFVGGNVNTEIEDGEACSTASDQASCLTVLASLGPFDEFPGSMLGPEPWEGYYLVTTSGDEALAHRSKADVVALLGTIDTAQEAALAVWASNWDIGCQEGGVRLAADGFDVLAFALTSFCEPIETSRYILHVSPSASLETLGSEVAHSSPGCI